MVELIILAGAEREILEAYVKLDGFQDGLGERFEQRVEETLSLIVAHPKIGPVFRGETRRRLVRGFPHAIFYEIEPRRIIVHAVLDLRQSPESIIRRLDPL